MQVTSLSPYPWTGCPWTALPAALACPVAEAALLRAGLPAEARQRLRTGALAVGQTQRESRTELPAALVARGLALAAGR